MIRGVSPLKLRKWSRNGKGRDSSTLIIKNFVDIDINQGLCNNLGYGKQ